MGADNKVSPTSFPNLRELTYSVSCYGPLWCAQLIDTHPLLVELSLRCDELILSAELLSALERAVHLRRLTLMILEASPQDCTVTLLKNCGQRLQGISFDLLGPSGLSELLAAASLCPLLETLTVSTDGDADLPDSVFCEFARHCPHLREIPLVADFDDALLSALGQAGLHLSELQCLRWCVSSTALVQRCAHVLSGVQKFSLSYAAEEDSFVSALAAALQVMTDLRHLDLPGSVQLEAELWGSSLRFSQLRGLNAYSDIGTGDLVRQIIQTSPLLELLQFPCTEAVNLLLTTAGQHCPWLKILVVDDVDYPITDSAMVALAQGCTHLQLVHLRSAAALTDATALALATHCRGLFQLVLYAAPFSETALQRLCTACRRLKEVGCATVLSPEALAAIRSDGEHRRAVRSFRRMASDPYALPLPGE